MSVDFTTLVYLANNDVARETLKTVFENRSIVQRDLIGRLKKAKAQIDPEQAKDELKKLEKMHLVESTGSIIEDFNTYYVTASGLAASREI